MSEIRTDRLVLRAIREEDTEDLLALLCDERVSRTFMLPEFPDREAALKLARRYCLLSEDPARFVMGICKDGGLIGIVNEVDKSETAMEIGYVIQPDLWNRGYATEMLKAVIPALFARGYDTVRAGFFEENRASARVMEKAGMHRTDQVDTVEYRGKSHRCLYCEIKKDESVSA